jgi:hypothetical protein
LPPLNNYLAFCQLGIYIPPKFYYPNSTYKQDKGLLHLSHRVHAGPDKCCAAIAEKTEKMSPLDANVWFCNDSEEAKDMFKYQTRWLDVKQPGLDQWGNTWMVLKPMDTHKMSKKFMKELSDHTYIDQSGSLGLLTIQEALSIWI